jgi:hypothetical protein
MTKKSTVPKRDLRFAEITRTDDLRLPRGRRRDREELEQELKTVSTQPQKAML